MRCKACDKELKDHEVRRRGLWSGEYIDFCDECFETIADDVSLSTGDEVLDKSIREDELDQQPVHDDYILQD